MAHPCFECGGECYCNGDLDDVITSKTPPNCRGCDSCHNDDNDFDDEEDYNWQPCDDCDLPAACADYGCANSGEEYSEGDGVCAEK